MLKLSRLPAALLLLFSAHAALAAVLLLLVSARATLAEDVSLKVDWPNYLARHDLKWNRPPDRWESGAFMGNGLLGANIFLTPDGKSLQWVIGRSDVADRGNRIPLGDMVLKTAGDITGGEFRLGLWNAEVTGTLRTSVGEIAIRSFTHSDDLVQVIELRPSDKEKQAAFDWVPGLAANPRYLYQKQPVPDGEKNPEPQITKDGAISLAAQPLKTGGGHVVARKEIPGDSGARVLLLSVGYSTRDLDAAKTEAVAAVNKAATDGLAKLETTHRQWWHKFWPESFVSFPDTRLESFYWIQLYKMASGTRPNRPALDLLGPWFRSTPWPRIWWNLNIQLTYWAQLASNRLELGESLCQLLDSGKAQLAKNAGQYSDDSYAVGRSVGYDLARPVSHELVGIPWTMHNYYLQYRYSMDDQMLRDRVFPLLKGSVNYYLHLLKPGDDGYLHISDGYSPEYPQQPQPNPDCNIDLALLRWGCQTLLDICARLNIDDPLIPRWKEVLAKLAPYPVDENGLKISASVPFAVSHRHYSHLLMIYPLYIMNLDQPENRELVTKSLKHWMGMSAALRGYSYTGASSISSLMGHGDDALNYLNMLFEGKRFGVHPNTMYTEAGPVVETPLSAAASVHDMLLTSWGNKIRVFPALPTAWRDVSIHNMRTEGAFLVSAVRKDGQTRFVRVESLAGEPCRIVTDLPNPKGQGVNVRKVAEGEYELDLKKGQSVVLTPDGGKVDLAITAVAPEPDKLNYWGLH